MARYMTVASVSAMEAHKHSPDALLDHASHMIWRAKQFGADIVSFPETYAHLASDAPYPEKAEPLSGPTLARVCEDARKHALHVIMPMYTLEGGRTYNSAVLVSPSGQVLGVYHKMFPTVYEVEGGITPGADTPVFHTDFGKVAMAICFDLNFPEIMRGLGDAGAEIIFFSSAYRGGLQLRAWAWELGCYIVSAIRAELGQIVDMSGELLAESTYEGLIAKRINLDRRLLHMDANWEKMDEMLRKYGPGVSFQYFTREGCYTIASERDGLTVEDLIREFDLEGRADYFNRSREVRRKALGL